MLLCDEAEELINIEKNNPEALPKLRRFFRRGENIYTVLTATKRLSKLEESSIPHTSPFLYGFVPPAYLTRLSDEEAKRLIGLGGFDDDKVIEIIEKSNNHPYLIQLICKRLFETQDLQKVIEEVSVDDMMILVHKSKKQQKRDHSDVDEILVNFRIRYLFGGEADYLKKDSIGRENGEVTYDINHSRTNLLTFQLGVAFTF